MDTYNFCTFEACECDPTGSTLEMCDGDTGICLCKTGYGGSMCDRCDVGFYGYPYCVGKYLSNN